MTSRTQEARPTTSLSLGSRLQRAARRIDRTLAGKPVVPLVVLLILIAMAVFAPWIAPHSPLQIDLTNALMPPFYEQGGSLDHVLGTDKLGRDVLSRLIYGSRVSLSLAASILLIGGTAGIVIGLVSGYALGPVDTVVQRGIEAILSLPTMMVALIFVVLLGQSFTSVILILCPFIAARFARMVRGEVLTLKHSGYIALARIAGASGPRILWKHILPNIAGTIIVIATLEIGNLILLEASLSFLGVGVPPPTPAWGLMVADGREYLTTAYWLSLFAGLAIVITGLSINLLGDWLRDVLDPKSQYV